VYHLELDEDYIIKPTTSKNSQTPLSQKEIVIVDKKNTGRLLTMSRWNGGLHEFLEIKHGLQPKKESLCPISLSHPIYFNRYQHLYGLTGTVGTSAERQELSQVYQLGIVQIPSHKKSQLQILAPKHTRDRHSHLETILQELLTMRSAGRPVLLILQSIRKTEEFAQYLKGRGIPTQVLNERQSEHENSLISKAGLPGVVTIATNTAGRGTDIEPVKLSVENGGLHVIIGFFPESERVEIQAYGRAGRQGQPGSGRMIILIDEALFIEYPQLLSAQQMLETEPFAILRQLRAERSAKLSEVRLQSIEHEKIHHQLLDTFLSHLTNWRNAIDNSFLNSLDERRFSLFDATKSDKEETCITSCSLGQPLLRYLSASKVVFRSPDSSWNTILLNAKSFIESEILQDWALHFYDKLEEHHFKQEAGLNATIINEKVNAFYDKWSACFSSPQSHFIRGLNSSINYILNTTQFQEELS